MREYLPSETSLFAGFARGKNVIHTRARARAGSSFVLQIRIQKWIQSSLAYFPAIARIRGPTVSRLCLFPRDMSRRDNGSFPFLGDVGETAAVNGNPFGDVNAKSSIQPQPRALIIKS